MGRGPPEVADIAEGGEDACFRLDCFGFRVSDFEFEVSGFGFRVSSFGFWVLG